MNGFVKEKIAREFVSWRTSILLIRSWMLERIAKPSCGIFRGWKSTGILQIYIFFGLTFRLENFRSYIVWNFSTYQFYELRNQFCILEKIWSKSRTYTYVDLETEYRNFRVSSCVPKLIFQTLFWNFGWILRKVLFGNRRLDPFSFAYAMYSTNVCTKWTPRMLYWIRFEFDIHIHYHFHLNTPERGRVAVYV